jgi:hypothetical protein
VGRGNESEVEEKRVVIVGGKTKQTSLPVLFNSLSWIFFSSIERKKVETFRIALLNKAKICVLSKLSSF